MNSGGRARVLDQEMVDKEKDTTTSEIKMAFNSTRNRRLWRRKRATAER